MGKENEFVKNQFLNGGKISLLFGGDIYLKHRISIPREILDLFNDVDYSILNLEAPIINNKLKFEKYPKSGPNLFQNEDVVGVLKRLGVKYIGGANNHIMDFGIEGIKSTSDILSKNDIFYSGFGKNLEQARVPLNLIDSNITILCVGEEEFGVSSEGCPGYYSMYFDEILEQIKYLKNRNKFVVIFAHGGGEEIPLPSLYIVNKYKEFIDSGADLVVGHHPHVPQGYEEYKGKLIFYSLGNFIHSSFTKSLGILLKVIIVKSAIKSFQIIPIMVQDNIAKIDCEQELNNYINLCNKVLQDALLRGSVYQEQAIYMYNSYYHSYFKNIFSAKKCLKSLIKRFLKKSQMSSKLESEFLLLNLIRNRSHREFIEIALKILTGEIKDLSDESSLKYFQDLMDKINKSTRI